jgi:hypothetical protein
MVSIQRKLVRQKKLVHKKLGEPGIRPGTRVAAETSDESRGGLDPLPGARLWLVDGYNALHCAPFRADPAEPARAAGGRPFWSEAMRERLVAVAGCFPDPDAEIWLIFDGPRAAKSPERGEQPKLRQLFALSADDWIVARVREEPEPSRIAVVSGDRRLTGRARHYGSAVVSPRLFLDYCLLNLESSAVEQDS